MRKLEKISEMDVREIVLKNPKVTKHHADAVCKLYNTLVECINNAKPFLIGISFKGKESFLLNTVTDSISVATMTKLQDCKVKPELREEDNLLSITVDAPLSDLWLISELNPQNDWSGV